MSLFGNKFATSIRVKWYPNYWDTIALLLVLAIISLFAFVAKGMTTPYKLGQAIPISLNPAALPFYASRTVVRMLIALFFSLLFTFIFGTWAAKSRHAERIIIPAIDILQAVPILGFLSVTIASFIRLFPGSLLGPECAAVFAIFTSQAWNMTFVFFQTVRSVPADLAETGLMFHLSAWQRFWRIEVPYATPGLLWNTMASMSAGWFFVVAAEAITVSNQDILLPGIGSFIAVAIKAADLRAIGYAVLTMFIVILIYDQLLFRPLVAWAEKFKLEQQATEKSAESWVMNLFRSTRLMRRWGATLGELFDAFVNIKFFRSAEDILFSKSIFQKDSGKWATILWEIGIVLAGILAFIFLWRFVAHHISFTEIRWVLVLGLITTSRVFILILLCSFIWVPLGIWIGLRPHVAQVAQQLHKFF